MAIEDVTEIVPEVATITPFQKLVLSIGEIPTNYLDSMSYAEQVTWFCMFLQEKVLPVVNQHSEKILEIINYLNNLDLQDEVNNKLDEMAESGQLQEIIADYLNSKAIFGFDSVADMKTATNLIDSSFAKTLGYHEKNDGGMATYKIRKITNADIVDEMLIIALNDEDLIAELIITDEINPEMLGAYGDGIHDDTEPLQIALSNSKNVILTKNYLISDTIEIKDTENINIKAEKSTINYNGNNSAILIYHLNGGSIKFGTIISSGNGIELKSVTGVSDRIMYVKLSFVRLTCENKNIYVNIATSGYINEIDLIGGQITSGDYGLYFDNSNTVASGCNAWRIENIGFEGCDTCLYYNATNQGRFMGHVINNIRYIENTTSKVLETHGNFYRCKLTSWGNLVESRLVLDYQNLTDFELKAPIYNEELTTLIATGIYYNGTRKRYLNGRTIKETLTGNANLTSGTITLFKIDNLVIISFADIVVTGTTTIDIIDENPYPPNSFIGNCNSIIMNGSASQFGRVLARTNGTIAVKVNDKTQTFNGEIAYYTDVSNVVIS